MGNTVTLEEVEALAWKLPPQDQRQLIADIDARLQQTQTNTDNATQEAAHVHRSRVHVFLEVSDIFVEAESLYRTF